MPNTIPSYRALKDFLSNIARAPERRRGALWFAALVLLGAVQADYSPYDSSLNVASSTAAHWAGAAGAFVADIIMQSIGFGFWFLFVPLLAWSIRAAMAQTISLAPLRAFAAIAALLFGSFALNFSGNFSGASSSFAFFTFFAVNSSVLNQGGVIGQNLYALYNLLPEFGTSVDNLVWSASAFAAFVLMLFASGWLLSSARLCVLFIARLFHIAARARTALVALMARSKQTEETTFSPAPTPTPTSTPTPTAPSARKPRAPRSSRTRTPKTAPHKTGDDFALPEESLLGATKEKRQAAFSRETQESEARRLEEVLSDFGIKGRIAAVRPGPVVTLYELELAAGIRAARVVGLADDIARSMSAVSCRVAAVPGANLIGIELPNATREGVGLRALIAADVFADDGTRSLTLALGKDIGGAPVFVDLARMPHLLVAGTTGSGKSVGINSMILSLLYRLTPDECRLILVDPKMLEFSVYDGIPHLLTPVVTEPKKAVVALKWVVMEMENRYRKMAKLNVRNIDGYNERMREALASGERLTRKVESGNDPETGAPLYEEEEIAPELLPYIVVVIDEMADLMMVAGKEIEIAVQRLAQMARAAGVHLITATQRPSVDVITGTIKANFPSRISFQVTSKIDSRTVLGEQGAEQLLGQGDMLYMEGGGRIRRVHGAFVSDGEVERVTTFLKSQAAPEYIEQVTQEPEELDMGALAGGDNALYEQAVAIVLRDRRATTSYLQRKLQIGYNRAARLIEEMETRGIVSAPNHAGKREVLS